MKTEIKEYLHFRKQEPEIIERNLDVIAGANLKILKIGLAVSVVIFSTVGVFSVFIRFIGLYHTLFFQPAWSDFIFWRRESEDKDAFCFCFMLSLNFFVCFRFI